MADKVGTAFSLRDYLQFAEQLEQREFNRVPSFFGRAHLRFSQISLVITVLRSATSSLYSLSGCQSSLPLARLSTWRSIPPSTPVNSLFVLFRAFADDLQPAGMERYATYINSCKQRPSNYEPEAMRAILQSWGPILFYHLDAEVQTLHRDNLRRCELSLLTSLHGC